MHYCLDERCRGLACAGAGTALKGLQQTPFSSLQRRVLYGKIDHEGKIFVIRNVRKYLFSVLIGSFVDYSKLEIIFLQNLKGFAPLCLPASSVEKFEVILLPSALSFFSRSL